MPTLKLKARNTKPSMAIKRGTPPDERELLKWRRQQWHEWDQVHQQRRSDPNFRHQARLRAAEKPCLQELAEKYRSFDDFISERPGSKWCKWYRFDPQRETYGWHSIIVETDWDADCWGIDLEYYKRHRRRGRKRHLNQSAVFSPLQFMPKRRIAALYVAHADHARSLAADFDEWDRDHQIRALIILSCGCYDREPGKS